MNITGAKIDDKNGLYDINAHESKAMSGEMIISRCRGMKIEKNKDTNKDENKN